MSGTRRGRRGFLKKSAALAGLALGAAETANAQTPAADAAPKNPKELAKELIAYGERSKFVTSVRVPVAERMSPDMYGLTFHVLTPLQDSVGHHHALVALLRRHASRLVRPRHRSERASADDPRHGGPPAGLHDGRAEAAARPCRAFTSSSASATARKPGTRPCRRRTG